MLEKRSHEEFHRQLNEDVRRLLIMFSGARITLTGKTRHSYTVGTNNGVNDTMCEDIGSSKSHEKDCGCILHLEGCE
jgi:hypothetical protein